MSKRADLLRDLYGDLRDRRLLPIVIVLLVAIVAVPFVLGGGTEPVPPPTPPASVSAGGGEDVLSPVVVADVPGLRDYRERLSRFNRRNPFTQQMVGDNTAQGGGGNLEQVGSTSTGTTAGTTGATGATEPDTPSAPPPDDGGPGGGDDGGQDRIVLTTIDVKVTHGGQSKVLQGVEPLQLVPGEQRPVVQFVEGGDDGTNAAFVVSGKVFETSGEGQCAPAPDDCQFLLMEKGDTREFVYGDALETYRLKILAINRTTVPA